MLYLVELSILGFYDSWDGLEFIYPTPCLSFPNEACFQGPEPVHRIALPPKEITLP